MIRRPTNSREWKTDQSRPADRGEQELSLAIQRSLESLTNKLKELVARARKQTEAN